MAKATTSSAHTAGPWHIRGDSPLLNGFDVGSNHVSIAHVEGWFEDDKATIAEAQANADLIAAAPELLERAKMSLADAEDALAHPEKVAGYNWQSIADDIRMIIAKAEGRS